MARVLPFEVLQCIFDYVAVVHQNYAYLHPLDHTNYLDGLLEQQTLVAAAQVCRQWQRPAERSLYRHILICDPDKASRLLRKLQWYRELGNGLETLRFFCLKPLSKSAQITIQLLLRKLPNLRNYSINMTRLPRIHYDGVVPTNEYSPRLERLDVIAHDYLPDDESDEAIHNTLSASRLPRTLKRLTLRGMKLEKIKRFKLPRLRYLALDCIAQESLRAGSFDPCKRLNHLVLNDPDRLGGGMLLRQLNHQLETLELNYDDQTKQDVLPIEHHTMKPLTSLVSFSLRGDFFESEVQHIPHSVKHLCWRGATDAEAINAFLQRLCEPAYLPNLAEFPTIYMPEEARYRYPSVRKVNMKKATNALLLRGLKPVYHEETSLWNEKMIFPRQKTTLEAD